MRKLVQREYFDLLLSLPSVGRFLDTRIQPQPQQQSYMLSLKSFDADVNTGLSFGHFNTLSGFPDLETNGLFDNRITSLN